MMLIIFRGMDVTGIVINIVQMAKRYELSDDGKRYPAWSVEMDELFKGKVIFSKNLWYRVQKTFVPYRKNGVMLEMVFENILN
jgi:hypothetical protein